MKLHPVSALCLGIAVSAAFLFAAVEPLLSFEFETRGLISEAYYDSQPAIADHLAVSPGIGGNIVKNTFSFLRLGSLRLFLLFGINIMMAFSKSFIVRKKQSHPISIKNSILLKLRI
jgi:hypothetical protein